MPAQDIPPPDTNIENAGLQVRHVSLSELLSMAGYYGVDISRARKEYWLLGAVKCAIFAPVVPPWAKEEVDGRPVFTHTESGKVSAQHPLDRPFLRLIQRMRTAGPPLDNESRCVIMVEGEDGISKAFDLSSGQYTVSDQPPEHLVLTCSNDQLPKYTKEVEEEWLSSSASATPRLHTAADEDHNSWEPSTGETRRRSVRIDRLPEQEASYRSHANRPQKSVRYLNFYTWWLEDHESDDLTFRDNCESVGGGITPRHLSLSLCLTTGTFDVTIKGCPPNEQVLQLKNISDVTTAQGMPVRAWDLAVGARLNILNNAVSLRACDVPTGLWLKSLADQVLAMKECALKDLRRFSQQALPHGLSHVRGEGGGRFLNSYTPAITQQRQGGVNVQAAAEQVEGVCTYLDKFRPSASAKYRRVLRRLRDETTRSRVHPYQSSPPSALQMLAHKALEDSSRAGTLKQGGSTVCKSTCKTFGDLAMSLTNKRTGKQYKKMSSSGQLDSNIDTEVHRIWPGPQVLLKTLPLSVTCPALVPAKGKDVWRTSASARMQKTA